MRTAIKIDVLINPKDSTDRVWRTSYARQGKPDGTKMYRNAVACAKDWVFWRAPRQSHWQKSNENDPDDVFQSYCHKVKYDERMIRRVVKVLEGITD